MSDEREETTQSPEPDAEPADAANERRHLAEVETGAGCTEIWEHLSEARDGDDRD
jgi:hypothetical protein